MSGGGIARARVRAALRLRSALRLRGTLRLVAGFGLFAALGLLAASLAPSLPASAETRIADISEGTNMSIALSPDRQVLVTDLLGRLWRLPANGGGAEPLTPEDEGARYPRFGKDGHTLVYQRLVDGQWDLWLLDLDTHERRALLSSAFNDRQPDFSADGRSVVFSSDRTGHYCLWSVDVASGVMTQLTEEPGDAFFPTVSDFGEIAYAKREGAAWTLRVLTGQGVSTEVARSSAAIVAPSWRPGGGVLIYNELDPFRSSDLKLILVGTPNPVAKTLTSGEDVFTTRVAWLSPSEYLYTADGHIWRRGIAQISRTAVPMFAAVSVDARPAPAADTPLDAPGPNPVLGIADRSTSADGRTEVFAALGDLWLVRGRDAPRRLMDDPFVDIDPSVSPDGKFAVFSSDRGGRMALWRVELPGGTLEPLASGIDKAYGAAVSPDGKRVAFLATDGFGPWSDASLRVLDLSPHGQARTLAADLAAPSRPRWDEAGDRISLEQRATGGRIVLEVDAATGRQSFPAMASVPPGAPPLSAALSASPASEAPRARIGAPSEPEPSDGQRRDAPMLEWSPAHAAEDYVVQVGRLFDGVRTDYQRHVDIHVHGQRIVAIAPRNVLPLPAKVIDARDATVIPGLIDAHVHESSIMGERLGKMWLASGVTTVRELTDDVPSALERAEAWASGRRLGPRVVVTAEHAAANPEAPRPSEPLLSPIPVRSYSALPMAYALLQPGGPAAIPAARVAPLVPDERADAVNRLRASPLSVTYQDVFRTVVESQTVVTSNLAAAIGPSGAPAAWKVVSESPVFRRLYEDAERARWPGTASGSVPARALEDNVARLVRAGGRIAAGSEAPAAPYGLGVHVELALLAEAGIPIDQVLRIATAQNAMALGVAGQLGTLEEGKLADFVVVDGNPLEKLSDAARIIAVVKGGVWLDEQRLLEK